MGEESEAERPVKKQYCSPGLELGHPRETSSLGTMARAGGGVGGGGAYLMTFGRELGMGQQKEDREEIPGGEADDVLNKLCLFFLSF